MKLALSMLCENPRRRTGLSTLFPEFVAAARRQFPTVEWVVFAGREQPALPADPGVEICRDFPSNERRAARLWADHWLVAAAARRRGAAALLTVGFMPVRTAGLPVAMQVFAIDPPGSGVLRSAYRRWAVGRGLRKAAIVIVNSAWAASRLTDPGVRVLVSPEGLRHDRFRPGPAPTGLGLPPTYLLWASNLYPYKRFTLALAAYALLPPGLRIRYPLVVAGGDWAGGRVQAEEAVRRLGLESEVRFLGWVDDKVLPGLYAGARLHLLSTEYETFGRSALEAMACGSPSVLQDLPVLREVAGEAACYVDYRDAKAASAAIAELCEDGARYSGLRAAGLARAAVYSFERLARERVGAVLQLLGAGS